MFIKLKCSGQGEHLIVFSIINTFKFKKSLSHLLFVVTIIRNSPQSQGLIFGHYFKTYQTAGMQLYLIKEKEESSRPTKTLNPFFKNTA